MSNFSINSVYLHGNAVKDAEHKVVGSNDTNLLTFSLVTNQRVKRGDEWEDEPSFHNIVFFGKLSASLAEQITKGTPVTVQGRIRYRKWEAKDGTQKYFTEILADKVIPTGKLGKSTNTTKAKPSAEVKEAINDDMPF